VQSPFVGAGQSAGSLCGPEVPEYVHAFVHSMSEPIDAQRSNVPTHFGSVPPSGLLAPLLPPPPPPPPLPLPGVLIGFVQVTPKLPEASTAASSPPEPPPLLDPELLPLLDPLLDPELLPLLDPELLPLLDPLPELEPGPGVPLSVEEHPAMANAATTEDARAPNRSILFMGCLSEQGACRFR
jgi:hypothetical protein